jgi:RNA polymerase sigma factor for flagellar operon FliA
MLKDPKNQKMLQDYISEHAPLIHKQINVLRSKGRIPSHIEEDDLHFAGIYGLVDALHKYNPQVGEKLKTSSEENPFIKYAEKRVQGKMLDHLAEQSEVPRVLRERAKNLANVPKKVGESD